MRVCIRFTNRYRSVPKGSQISPEVYLKVHGRSRGVPRGSRICPKPIDKVMFSLETGVGLFLGLNSP